MRLADELWLAGHDTVGGKPSIGEWPLGVGLATGLLAELIRCELLGLRDGELFRAVGLLSGDPALDSLLAKMEAEERDWQQSPPVTRVQASVQYGWERPGPVEPDLPASRRRSLHPVARESSRAWPPASSENRHQSRGHELGTWMSYLAYGHRAENLVIDRLARAGLVKQAQHRRLFRGTTTRFMPYDSVVAGTPASAISTAVQRGHKLPLSGLLLAGLFLATGLHHHALATLTPTERATLADHIDRRLDGELRQLLQAADAAVGEAAMR